MTERARFDPVSKIHVDAFKSLPNVSLKKLGGGFNKFLLPEQMIKNSVKSVVSMYAKHQDRLFTEGIRSQIVKDAHKLGIKSSEYLEILALHHEKLQDYPSKDVNVVMIRFITHLHHHLMEGKGSYPDLVHDLQEIREKLSRREGYVLRAATNELETQVAKNRLNYIFS
jgi:hypothetical protein